LKFIQRKALRQFVLANFLPYQLSILASGISRDFSKEYISRFGLNNAEWRIIAHLSQETETDKYSGNLSEGRIWRNQRLVGLFQNLLNVDFYQRK
jgi:hypothetical protein